MGEALGDLSERALHLKARVDALTGDSVVLECEEYLKENREPRTPRGHARSPTPPSAGDRGQKNWQGGPEGAGEKVSRRLVFEDPMRDCSHAVGSSSGPPYRFHGNWKDDEGGGSSLKAEGETAPFESRPLAVTRRRSYSTKEDLERHSSAQGILKKSSCPPYGTGRIGGSFDASAAMDGAADPRPILKKTMDEEPPPGAASDPRKKSILKKKSFTDDELDADRPRSILKGARSREDLADRSEADGGASPPVPILKRGSRDPAPEADAAEQLRPILKRRDTSDGVRTALPKGPSDASGVEKAEHVLVRRDSAPLPSHGILKRRPGSPAFEVPGDEKPLSVAERIAGMEAMSGAGPEPSQGAKPKVRSLPPAEGALSPALLER